MRLNISFIAILFFIFLSCNRTNNSIKGKYKQYYNWLIKIGVEENSLKPSSTIIIFNEFTCRSCNNLIMEVVKGKKIVSLIIFNSKNPKSLPFYKSLKSYTEKNNIKIIEDPYNFFKDIYPQMPYPVILTINNKSKINGVYELHGSTYDKTINQINIKLKQ